MGLGNANHLSPGEVRIFGRSHSFQGKRKELYKFDCQLTANEGGGEGGRHENITESDGESGKFSHHPTIPSAIFFLNDKTTKLTFGKHFIIFVIVQHSPLFTKLLSAELSMI